MDSLSGVHVTALGAAAARARHLISDGLPKILVDPYAQRLLGWDNDEIINRTNHLAEGPSGVGFWVLRSRFVEDRLSAAIRRGVTQYVVLGAGLDSFALRNVDALSCLSVFEVDDPPLQKWKRERLSKLGIAIPAGLHFVSCNFEFTSVDEVLRDAGFNPRAPTVVSWLGVTQYLTRSAIDETLGWVASLATGSEIVLTYVVPSQQAESRKADHAIRGARFETFFTPAEIGETLKDAGLVDIEFLSPKQAQRVYFEGRSDGLVAPETERLVVAMAV